MDKRIELIKSKYGESAIIEAVGNHHLERNYVYRVNNKTIFKFYRMRKNWERELRSLIMIADTSSLYPEIVSFSNIEDELIWLETTIKEGDSFLALMDKIQGKNIQTLYYALGTEHAKLHKKFISTSFFDWAKTSSSYKVYESYHEFEYEKNRRRALTALELDNADLGLLRRAYDQMIYLEPVVKDDTEFALCHNDFSERNVLVESYDGVYKISGVIDFELSHPCSIESDVARTIFNLYFNDHRQDYLTGYDHILKLSDTFEEKLEYHLIAKGLEVCSWVLERDKDYYDYAIRILRDLVL